MISYTQEQGLTLLASLPVESTEWQLNDEQKLSIAFSAIGLTAGQTEDLRLFNERMPIFTISHNAEVIQPGATSFTLTTTATREPQSGGVFTTRPLEKALQYCLTKSFRFIAALAISTNTIITWRRINTPQIGVISHGRSMPPTLIFQEIHKIFERNVELHAGHLWMAINVFTSPLMQDWPNRFYQLYDKGMTLLSAPEVPEMSFLEESYNCFFKCLEFIVMAKVLKQKGQYKSQLLNAAFNKLNIVAKDAPDSNASARITANRLAAQRGNIVAHYTLGKDNAAISVKEVFELKSLVDFMLRAYVTTGLIAASAGRNAFD